MATVALTRRLRHWPILKIELVTKDRDFRDSHLLGGTPRRLLAVLTGNITNAALLTLFDTHLEQIVAALDESHFVELDSTSLTLHEDRPTD